LFVYVFSYSVVVVVAFQFTVLTVLDSDFFFIFAVSLINVKSDELQAIKQQISVSQQQLERLKRTNVFNDAFHITSDGHFGTINGFRLGRLPSQAVEWGEINAALGQVVLLLHTIAERCNYKFKQYKLIPMGSFSKISRLDDPSAEHELYQSSDMTLGKLFWYRRFDTVSCGWDNTSLSLSHIYRFLFLSSF